MLHRANVLKPHAFKGSFVVHMLSDKGVAIALTMDFPLWKKDGVQIFILDVQTAKLNHQDQMSLPLSSCMPAKNDIAAKAF